MFENIDRNRAFAIWRLWDPEGGGMITVLLASGPRLCLSIYPGRRHDGLAT